MAKRCRWLRFSLGTIMLLISAVAIWLGTWSNTARNQRVAAEALARAGYMVKFDVDLDTQKPIVTVLPARGLGIRPVPAPTPTSQLSKSEAYRRELIRRYLGRHYADRITGFSANTVEPTLNVTPPTAKEWKRIQSLRSIRQVRLGEGATDEDLENVSRIPGIVDLSLNSEQLTERGFAALENLRELRSLSIEKIRKGERITGLRGLPGLISLQLDYVIELDDVDAKHLSNSTMLRKLSQTALRVSDEGLLHLSQLPHLQELDLSFNDEITDKGMKFVARMKELTRLELAGTSITNAGLDQVADLPKLKYLNLVSSKVTHEEVLRLRERYPNRNIAHWVDPAPAEQ